MPPPPKAVGRKVQAVDINGIFYGGKVIGYRQHEGVPQQLIRWLGYGAQYNTWSASTEVRAPETYRLPTSHPKRGLLKNVIRGDRVKADDPGSDGMATVYVVEINDPFHCRVSFCHFLDLNFTVISCAYCRPLGLVSAWLL